MTTQSIPIANGNKRAVFLNDGEGWCPDWFYEAERPMLRFKDHEWLLLQPGGRESFRAVIEKRAYVRAPRQRATR